MPQTQNATPDLVADIGGTNARFALVDASGRLHAERILPCADFAGPSAAIVAYLRQTAAPRPQRAALAVATPISGDRIAFTNNNWSFSTEAVRQELGLERLVIVNDFTALALALPLLAPNERRAIGQGTAIADAPIGLIGPGTGLGVSGLIRAGQQWAPLETEGGHVTFSATDEREWAISRVLQRQFGHASLERLLSGPGLVNLYHALAEVEGWTAESLMPADITARGLSDACPHCRAVLDLFCGALGTAAGNLAITLGARGGVYVGGGIVPRLGDFFDRSAFRSRFETKGRFSAYLATIPTWVVTAATPALRGAAVALG